MPYQVGQDIGGFGRLAEMKFRVSAEKRAQAQEDRQSELANLQIESTRENIIPMALNMPMIVLSDGNMAMNMLEKKAL
jgi:hypothetical protein